ncbi:MAG: hypothetical protein ACPL88_09280 [Bryobacteraceae bacterium]
MRRKSVPGSSQTVAREILDHARRSLESEKPKKAARCVVCGGEVSPTSTESLCWVCRRLKISAWREVEQQMPAQE